MKNFESVEIFRNKHKGQIGFVLGAGPSLANYDINRIIKNGVSFCCNSSIVAVDKCDYFLLTDGAVPYYNFYEKAATVSKNFIFAGRGIDYKYYYEDINGYGEKIVFSAKKYLVDRRYDKFGRPFNSNNSENSANFDYRDGLLVDGSNVSHPAAHFAYICGCDPIILIGIDMIYKNDNRYFKSLTESEIRQRNNSPYRDMDNPLYFQKNSDNTDHFLLMGYESWKKIKIANPNLNILNTNKDGLLVNLFETIDVKKYEL